MSFFKKAFRSSISNSLLNIVNLIIGLLLTPYVVHSLGDVQNGYWVMAKMIFGYYGFLDFGISLSVARFLSVAIGEKNTSEAIKIVQTGFGFILLLDIFLAVICFISVGILGQVSFAENMTLVRQLTLIMGISIIAILPGRIFSGVLTAHIRQDIVAWIGIFNAVIRAVLTYIALRFGYGVVTLAIISGMVVLLSTVLYYMVARILMPELRLRIFGFDKKTFAPLFNYGFFISLASMSDIIRAFAAPVTAGIVFGAAFVTHFNIAVVLGRYSVSIISSAFSVLMPVFGQLLGDKNNDKIQKVFFMAMNITVIISVFIFGGMILLGNDFIHLWMGAAYTDAYPALAIISVGLMIAIMQNPVITLMQGMGLAKVYAVTNGIEAILNIIFCFLLGKYGMMGLALSITIPMLLVKLLIQPYAILTHTKWNIYLFYKNILSQLFLAVIGVIISWAIFLLLRNLNVGIIIFFIKGVVYSVVTGLFMIFFVLKREERKYLESKIFLFKKTNK